MRPEPCRHLDRYRKTHPTLGASPPGAVWGYFEWERPSGTLRIISSGTPGKRDPHQWEHVSVSLATRCPTWPEMCLIKQLFWDDEEAVMELHPPRSQYVNFHKYALHLWRPIGVAIPQPPSILVGPQQPAEKIGKGFRGE